MEKVLQLELAPSDGVVLVTNIYDSLCSLNTTVIFNDMLNKTKVYLSKARRD